MPAPNQLLEAARALDWGKLEPLLRGLPGEERSERIEWLVGEVRQQGYTKCRRPANAAIARRDNFRQSFRAFLDNNGLKEVADKWRDDDATTSAVEWGYHQILASVQSQVQGELLPDRHVWATLRHLESEFEIVQRAVADWKPREGQVLDHATTRITLPDGSEVQPDDYITTLTNATTATLKMLGIANHWFREADKRLILPTESPANPADMTRVSNVLSLGVIWQLLERTDQHMRFFGGEARIEEKDLSDAKGSNVRVTVQGCSIDGGLIIYDQIAHERRSRMLMQFWHQLNWETNAEQKVSKVTPVALPPAAFVSLEEAFADVSISQFLCKAIAEHQDEPGGLRIIEWVRGYASLKLFAQERGAAMAGDLVPLDRDQLFQFLSVRGLTPSKVDCFIESIIFSQEAPDLFDAPLLEAADGRLFLCASVAGEVNPVEVVLSKLATVSADLAWRGPAFEETVRELFHKQGMEITLHGAIGNPIFRLDYRLRTVYESLIAVRNKDHRLIYSIVDGGRAIRWLRHPECCVMPPDRGFWLVTLGRSYVIGSLHEIIPLGRDIHIWALDRMSLNITSK